MASISWFNERVVHVGLIEVKMRDVAAALTEAGGKWLNGDYEATTFLTHPREAVQVVMTHDSYVPGQLDFFERDE